MSGTRGVVMVGGGVYFASAYVSLRVLRHVGCALPVELWHLPGEIDDKQRALLEPLGVTCIEADPAKARILGGWQLKAWSVLYSGFQEVLYLDADCYPVEDPTPLFDDPGYLKHGALFWPDPESQDLQPAAWEACGLEYRKEAAFESGQFIVDRSRCVAELELANWINQHSDYFYNIPLPGTPKHALFGDKDTFHMAWRRLDGDYAVAPRPDWVSVAFVHKHPQDKNRPMFVHRCRDKFTLEVDKAERKVFEKSRQNHAVNRFVEALPQEAFCFSVRGELCRMGRRPSECRVPDTPAMRALTAKLAPPFVYGQGRRIRVIRKIALGDAVMASAACAALGAAGFEVVFSCEAKYADPILHHPYILPDDGGPVDATIDFTMVYEGKGPERLVGRRQRFFAAAAVKQLADQGIDVPSFPNLTPVLFVSPAERSEAEALLSDCPRPWVMVCPSSRGTPTRTVSGETWLAASRASGVGTWFWTGQHPGPSGMRDLNCRSVRRLMAFLALADVAAAVDSGPMHLAAALGIPVVAVRQSYDPDLSLSDQRDYSVVSAPLSCLNCHGDYCPLGLSGPPCVTLDPAIIVAGVVAKLRATTGEGVSAIVAVYKPDLRRLERCMDAVLPQVDEVLISLDGDASIPADALPPNARVIPNPGGARTGYGATANRAARHAMGRNLLLLNDDCYLHPGAVAHMLEAIRSDPKVGVVGCRLWFPDGTIQHGGTERRPGEPGWSHVDSGARVPTITARCEMDGVTLAAAIVRRECFFQVGAFDTRWDCYHEDLDFCVSAIHLGWKILYEPAAEGVHEQGQTTSQMNKELFANGAELFADKWGLGSE